MNRRGFLGSLLGATAAAPAVAVAPATAPAAIAVESVAVKRLFVDPSDLMAMMSEQISRDIDEQIIAGLMREARPRGDE